jgi:hypothetical protein
LQLIIKGGEEKVSMDIGFHVSTIEVFEVVFLALTGIPRISPVISEDV